MLFNPLTPGAVSTIGGAGTTLKKFQSNIVQRSGPNVGQVIPFYGSVTDFLVPLPNNGKINGAQFSIIASGNVYVHGTTPTVNFSLIGNLGNTPQTDVVMATLTTAQTLTTNANYDWTLSAKFYGSAAPGTVGQVGGSGSLQVVNLDFYLASTDTIALASFTIAALTGVNFFGSYGTNYPSNANNAYLYPPAFLKLGLTFGVSDALNLASLTEFYGYSEQT